MSDDNLDGALYPDLGLERERLMLQLLDETTVYLRCISSQSLGVYVTAPNGSALAAHIWALHQHASEVLTWLETRTAALRPVPPQITQEAALPEAQSTAEAAEPAMDSAPKPLIH